MASWARKKGRRWKGVPWVQTRFARSPWQRFHWALRCVGIETDTEALKRFADALKSIGQACRGVKGGEREGRQ